MLQMDRPAPDCASLHRGYGPSLRAKRSNPALSPRQRKLDCFVALLLAMTGKERTLRQRFARRANQQETCLASFGKISFWNCGNYGDTKFFFMHANAPRVARMQRSEIRGNAANGSTGPGLRFAPSRLRPSLRANGSRERAPDDRLREAIQLCRRDKESWIASSRCSSQ